jgi:hypothetical protein
VEYPDANSDDGPPAIDDGSDGGGDDAGDDTDDEQVGDSEPVVNEALAAATRDVADELVWFATEYPDAMATFRAAMEDLLAVIDDVRETADEDAAVTVSMVDRLDDAVLDAAERAAEALEPHFRPTARIRGRARTHIETLRTVAPRNDVDRFLEEVDRLRSQFAGMDSRTYVASEFSRNPIHNRLLDRLLYPLPTDDEDREDVRESAFVELALTSRGFDTLAYEPHEDGQRPRIYGTPFPSDRRQELRARLGPIPRSANRTEELFVAFATRPEATFAGWPYELDGTPLYVQRYPDASTARDRLEGILDDAPTEGRAPIDPDAGGSGSGSGDEGGTDDGSAGPATRWHRLYHDEARGERYGYDEHAGVQYGYVVQAGEFVLATGFSGDAWEERAGWQGRLADGWVMG